MLKNVIKELVFLILILYKGASLNLHKYVGTAAPLALPALPVWCLRCPTLSRRATVISRITGLPEEKEEVVHRPAGLMVIGHT